MPLSVASQWIKEHQMERLQRASLLEETDDCDMPVVEYAEKSNMLCPRDCYLLASRSRYDGGANCEEAHT